MTDVRPHPSKPLRTWAEIALRVVKLLEHGWTEAKVSTEDRRLAPARRAGRRPSGQARGQAICHLFSDI
jgi:hypothetical protein